jgi:hypothetical protein
MAEKERRKRREEQERQHEERREAAKAGMLDDEEGKFEGTGVGLPSAIVVGEGGDATAKKPKKEHGSSGSSDSDTDKSGEERGGDGANNANQNETNNEVAQPSGAMKNSINQWNTTVKRELQLDKALQAALRRAQAKRLLQSKWMVAKKKILANLRLKIGGMDLRQRLGGLAGGGKGLGKALMGVASATKLGAKKGDAARGVARSKSALGEELISDDDSDDDSEKGKSGNDSEDSNENNDDYDRSGSGPNDNKSGRPSALSTGGGVDVTRGVAGEGAHRAPNRTKKNVEGRHSAAPGHAKVTQNADNESMSGRLIERDSGDPMRETDDGAAGGETDESVDADDRDGGDSEEDATRGTVEGAASENELNEQSRGAAKTNESLLGTQIQRSSLQGDVVTLHGSLQGNGKSKKAGSFQNPFALKPSLKTEAQQKKANPKLKANLKRVQFLQKSKTVKKKSDWKRKRNAAQAYIRMFFVACAAYLMIFGEKLMLFLYKLIKKTLELVYYLLYVVIYPFVLMVVAFISVTIIKPIWNRFFRPPLRYVWTTVRNYCCYRGFPSLIELKRHEIAEEKRDHFYKTVIDNYLYPYLPSTRVFFWLDSQMMRFEDKIDRRIDRPQKLLRFGNLADAKGAAESDDTTSSETESDEGRLDEETSSESSEMMCGGSSGGSLSSSSSDISVPSSPEAEIEQGDNDRPAERTVGETAEQSKQEQQLRFSTASKMKKTKRMRNLRDNVSNFHDRLHSRSRRSGSRRPVPPTHVNSANLDPGSHLTVDKYPLFARTGALAPKPVAFSQVSGGSQTGGGAVLVEMSGIPKSSWTGQLWSGFKEFCSVLFGYWDPRSLVQRYKIPQRSEVLTFVMMHRFDRTELGNRIGHGPSAWLEMEKRREARESGADSNANQSSGTGSAGRTGKANVSSMNVSTMNLSTINANTAVYGSDMAQGVVNTLYNSNTDARNSGTTTNPSATSPVGSSVTAPAASPATSRAQLRQAAIKREKDRCENERRAEARRAAVYGVRVPIPVDIEDANWGDGGMT